MTKGIAGTEIAQRKAAKATKLTPVAGETPTTIQQMADRIAIPDVPEVFLTKEAVADIARDLRRQAAVLIEVADGLDKYGDPILDTVAAEPAKVGKVEKRLEGTDPLGDPLGAEAASAKSKFDKDFAAKSAAAQAATFASLDDGSADEEVLPEVHVTNVDGWVCPKHGDTDIVTLTSRNNRVYRSCNVPTCKQFERKTP